MPILEFLFFVAAFLFLWRWFRALFCLRWAQRLPSQRQPLAKKPRVSVVLAARDEEARVKHTLRHILAQEQIDLEVIPVSDRARDRTDSILKQVALEDSRVHPQRVDVLPDGWLGKCYACHVGASCATGDWILFTDADCWLKPDVIARAIVVAEREGVDHITLTPGVAPQTLAAEGWHLAFLISLADWFARVNQDKPDGHLGAGAFNLVRTSLYKKFGGYAALRLSVVDDIKLGRLVRRAGGRTRAFIGGDDVECHWGVTVPSMIKIMEKTSLLVSTTESHRGSFLGGF
jgi:glycosyltransferase involved in cell wall biosynthesis